MTYLGRTQPPLSSSYNWTGTKYIGTAFPPITASLYKNFLPAGGYLITQAPVSGPAVAGQAVLSEDEDYYGTIVFRAVLCNTETGITASTDTVVRLYNLTAGNYVDIGGPGVTTLSVRGNNPKVVESVDLLNVANFNLNGTSVYEVRVHTTDTDYQAIHCNSMFVWPAANSLYAPLSTSLPNELTLSRTGGPWSYKSTNVLSGAQFIVTGTAANTPRFQYSSAFARHYLLIEPLRTQMVITAAFMDRDANNIPDGWNYTVGTPGNDFTITPTGAPWNPAIGAVFEAKNTAGNKGCYSNATIATTDGVTYVASAWFQGSSVASDLFMYTARIPSSYGDIEVPAGTYGWTRAYSVDTQNAPGINNDYTYFLYYKSAVSTPFSICMPQLERAGAVGGTHESCFEPSTWIPTSESQEHRPAEVVSINQSLVNVNKGRVRFRWISSKNHDPGGDNSGYLFSWSPTDHFSWNWTLQQFVVTYNSTVGAVYDAIMAPDTIAFDFDITWGPSGHILAVSKNNGAWAISSHTGKISAVSNPTLGSLSDGTGQAGGMYGNFYLDK